MVVRTLAQQRTTEKVPFFKLLFSTEFVVHGRKVNIARLWNRINLSIFYLFHSSAVRKKYTFCLAMYRFSVGNKAYRTYVHLVSSMDLAM